jgi:hypothetical protein
MYGSAQWYFAQYVIIMCRATDAFRLNTHKIKTFVRKLFLVSYRIQHIYGYEAPELFCIKLCGLITVYWTIVTVVSYGSLSIWPQQKDCLKKLFYEMFILSVTPIGGQYEICPT